MKRLFITHIVKLNISFCFLHTIEASSHSLFSASWLSKNQPFLFFFFFFFGLNAILQKIELDNKIPKCMLYGYIIHSVWSSIKHEIWLYNSVIVIKIISLNPIYICINRQAAYSFHMDFEYFSISVDFPSLTLHSPCLWCFICNMIK